METLYNVVGYNPTNPKEYAIASDTAVKKGAVVVLGANNRVSLAAAAQTSAVLGIAAEDHPGVADALNGRANGTKILVYDNPFNIVEGNAHVIKAAASQAASKTVLTVDDGVIDGLVADAAIGGYLKLVKAAAGSGLTEGTIFAITDSTAMAGSTKATITIVNSVANISAGDEFEFYPPVGATIGNFDTDRVNVVLTANAALAYRVVGAKYDDGKILYIADEHVYGVDLD